MPFKKETPDALFDQILDSLCAEGVPPETTRKLAKVKALILSPPIPTTIAAKDFNIDEAICAFGLEFHSELIKVPGGVGLPQWRIQDMPETKEFVLTPRLRSLFANYAKNFDRSSIAVRRTALDFMLNECLTIVKYHGLVNLEADNRSQRTPTPFDKIRVFGEVSFSHTITRSANGKSGGSFLGLVVYGRVGRSIGRVLPTGPPVGAMNRLVHRFQSLLLIVEALTLESALPQLVVYLASLHQSRLQRNRRDATVYGVVSDGYAFMFVTITHGGELKQSERFTICGGDVMMQTALGCLIYVLEVSAKTIPNVTPKAEDQGDSDSDLDIYDNDNVSPSPL